MIYCSHCGADNIDDGSYCVRCGSRLGHVNDSRGEANSTAESTGLIEEHHGNGTEGHSPNSANINRPASRARKRTRRVVLTVALVLVAGGSVTAGIVLHRHGRNTGTSTLGTPTIHLTVPQLSMLVMPRLSSPCSYLMGGPISNGHVGALAANSADDVYLIWNDQVEMMTPSKPFEVIAGTGHSGRPTPGPAIKSDFYDAAHLAVDSVGDVFIQDVPYGHPSTVYKLTPSGMLSAVPGTTFNANSEAMTVDSAGDVFVVVNNVVYKVTPSGERSVVAGNGKTGPVTPGPATKSALDNPISLAVDSTGDLYILNGTDSTSTVYKVTTSGELSTVPGTGFSYPTALGVDSAGDLYIISNDIVYKITPSGKRSIFAGNGGPITECPEPGPAAKSALDVPAFLAVDAKGDLYITDLRYGTVFKIAP